MIGKLKVAFLTHFPTDPDYPRGGVEAVSVTLARHLAMDGDLDVHVVTFNSGPGAPPVSPWHKLTVHRLPNRGGSMLINSLWHYRAALKACLDDLGPSLIHAHDTYGLMAGSLDLPRIMTIHGFIYADTRISGTRYARLRSLLWRHAEISAWRNHPYIISISPYVRERISYQTNATIRDIDNPIHEDFFHIRRRPEKHTIFSAGLISPRKNPLTLIKGFMHLLSIGYDAQLRIAGPDVNADYANRVRKTILNNGLGNRVHLLGQIGTPEIMNELAAASVFALVSLEENSPMAIAEAMAAGLPVVTSNRCGMPYMVGHGKSGFLVNPDDPMDVARRLRQLLDDGALRETMGNHARATALERFHPSVVARKTKEVYIEACSSEPNL